MICGASLHGSRRAYAAVWLGVWLSVALAGCEVLPSGSGTVSPGPRTPTRLGTVTAMAATVSVNNRPVQGTVPLNDGDKVATDATGRVHVELPGRGTVDLEVNTDPWFVREGACVVVRIIFGGALVSGSSLCVEDDQGTRVALGSAIHVHVGQGRTSITVVEGTVHLQRIARVQTLETLTSLQRVTIANGRVQQRAIVPRTEVDVLRQRFLIPAQRMQPGQPPPQIIR